MVISYHFALLTLEHLLHLQEAYDGVFDSVEEGALPVDGPCNGRLILIQRGVILVLQEDIIDDVYL